MIGVGEYFPYFELQGVDSENHMGTVSRDDFEDWKVFYFYLPNRDCRYGYAYIRSISLWF